MTACTATTKAGRPCAAHPPAGGTLCALHDPALGPEARAKGTRAARALREADAAKLHLDTPEDVRALIEETAARLRAGQIPAASAVALDRLARTALASIEARILDDAQQEIAEAKASRPAGLQRRR